MPIDQIKIGKLDCSQQEPFTFRLEDQNLAIINTETMILGHWQGQLFHGVVILSIILCDPWARLSFEGDFADVGRVALALLEAKKAAEAIGSKYLISRLVRPTVLGDVACLDPKSLNRTFPFDRSLRIP